MRKVAAIKLTHLAIREVVQQDLEHTYRTKALLAPEPSLLHST